MQPPTERVGGSNVYDVGATIGTLSITGAVITPKGGVVGAIVDLGGNGDGLKAITGTNGAYAFSNLGPGSYSVSVEPVSNCSFGGNIPLNNLTTSAAGINIIGSCTGTVPVLVGPQGPAGPVGATGPMGAVGRLARLALKAPPARKVRGDRRGPPVPRVPWVRRAPLARRVQLVSRARLVHKAPPDRPGHRVPRG